MCEHHINSGIAQKLSIQSPLHWREGWMDRKGSKEGRKGRKKNVASKVCGFMNLILIRTK